MPCSAWTKTSLFSMYPLCFVHDDSQTENFLLYNPQSRLSERITSPHPFRVQSPLPPFTRTLAPRSLDTRPPLLPPRKLRFEISHFRALCRPSPLKAAKMAMCPHLRAHPNRWSIHRLGCSVLGRGAEPPQFWVLLIWLEPGISHVTWVHYDATMCLPCFVCSILPVLHFLRFDLCVL